MEIWRKKILHLRIFPSDWALNQCTTVLPMEKSKIYHLYITDMFDHRVVVDPLSVSERYVVRVANDKSAKIRREVDTKGKG
jgi:hypothetical protein